MQFKMERRAPYALAVQAAVAIVGIGALAVHLMRPAPPPASCDTPAQILYENHTACLPSAEALVRALEVQPAQDFVRAAYLRDEASGAWVRIDLARNPLQHRPVVEPTGRLVTKD